MGDVLTLHEDGTVTVGWDDVSATLRRPKVGEWLSFMEESERADDWNPHGEVDGELPPRTYMDLVGPDGPYLTLWRRVLAELGGTSVEREDMPPWLADGAVFRNVSGWWRTNPLLRPAVAAMATGTP